MPSDVQQPGVMDLQIIDADTPRAEIVEALGHVVREAIRAQHVVGTVALPTRHDRLHATLDALLDLLVGR